MLVKTIVTDDLPRGVNARNWPGLIKIRPDLKYLGAVWAQEAYEAMLKMAPWNMILHIFSASFRRSMELMGHEIEVQAALRFYEADSEKYRWSEAYALVHGYDDFSGYTEEKVERELRKRSKQAVRWVDDYADDIREWV